MNTLFSLLITALFIITAQLGYAASFDCAKAASKVEKMICADKELSKLDDQLAEHYKIVQRYPDFSRPIKAQQVAWLEKRNACQDRACIKQAYLDREEYLAPMVPSIQAQLKEQAETNRAKSIAFDAASTNKKLNPPKRVQYEHCADNPQRLATEDCGNGRRGLPGKGLVFCESYLKFLNKQAKPLTCDIPIPPGFTKPNWQMLDVKQHLDWAFQMEKMTSFEVSKNYSFDAWKKQFLKEWQSGKIMPRMRLLRLQLPDRSQSVIDLLGYSRDIDGCRKIPDNEVTSNYDNSGYLHFVLINKKEVKSLYASPNAKKMSPNIFIPEPSTSLQELMLFRGKPYFVYQNKHIGILFSNVSAFFPLIYPNLDDYVETQCILIPSHSGK